MPNSQKPSAKTLIETPKLKMKNPKNVSPRSSCVSRKNDRTPVVLLQGAIATPFLFQPKAVLEAAERASLAGFE
jgi:hypothetical protein